MSFTLTFEAKRNVSSSKADLWQAFINSCGLQHMVEPQNADNLSNIYAKGLFLKPLGFNYSVPARIIEFTPRELISFTCRFYSITCFQSFSFKNTSQGAEIKATEILTGYLLILARLFYSPKRLSMSYQSWLKEIAESAKSMT